MSAFKKWLLLLCAPAKKQQGASALKKRLCYFNPLIGFVCCLWTPLCRIPLGIFNCVISMPLGYVTHA